MRQNFRSFDDFYPFYLQQHSTAACRRLHLLGLLASLGVVVGLILAQKWAWLPLALGVGYGFSWVGHFAFEKNRPATFENPLYSLRGDFTMARDILRGRIRL